MKNLIDFGKILLIEIVNAMLQNNNLKEINIFISYAEEDHEYLEKIKKYALKFNENQKIEIWDDGNISLGRKWDAEIKMHLNKADIILLFISLDFLASDYISSVELKAAFERFQNQECEVIPIFIREALLDEYPQLEALQGYPKGKVFAKIEDEDADIYYIGLAKEIKEVINKIRIRAGMQSEENKEIAQPLIKQENAQTKILLTHCNSILSQTMKDYFLSEVEREKKYKKKWEFDIRSYTYPELEVKKEEGLSIFNIRILTSEEEIKSLVNDNIAMLSVDINSCQQYKKNILWVSDSSLEEILPTSMKSIKTIVGTKPTDVIEEIYSLEDKRLEFIRTEREKFSQQMNVYMLYDDQKDDDNAIRIRLKKRLENRNELVLLFTSSPPFVQKQSAEYKKETLERIRRELELSKGVIIFYGTAQKNWYKYWQSEVQKMFSLKAKAVCLSEPEKQMKINRDVSKNAFIIIDDDGNGNGDDYGDDRDLNLFIENLRK